MDALIAFRNGEISSVVAATLLPPRSADLIQLSVAPESECRARGYAVQFTVY